MINFLKSLSLRHYQYNISFKSDKRINFQYFDKIKYFKYDFTKKGPLILNQNTYYLEIDISSYELNEYIVFIMNNNVGFNIKYQFKSNLKHNCFFDLGNYLIFNYIPIKKRINDSSLLLVINCIRISTELAVLDLYNYKTEEISLNNNYIFKGQKLLFIDKFLLNNTNSIGIQANKKYIFYTQIRSQYFSKPKNQSISIIYSDLFYNTGDKYFILFYLDDEYTLEIKSFNYSILKNRIFEFNYFEMCQGEDTSQELYFYTEDFYSYREIFTPVFGKFSTFFISEREIKSLSDLNFDNVKENYYLFGTNLPGYLKIKCNNATMIKYFVPYITEVKIFNSGKTYYIDNFSKNYTFHESLLNQTLKLKFTVYGIGSKQSIILYLDGVSYELDNAPIEIEYYHKIKSSNTIYFKGNNLYFTFIEIMIDFLEKDLVSYNQLDLVNSLGYFTVKENEARIIKIPHNITEDLNDIFFEINSNNYQSYKYYSFDIIYNNKSDFQRIMIIVILLNFLYLIKIHILSFYKTIIQAINICIFLFIQKLLK